MGIDAYIFAKDAKKALFVGRISNIFYPLYGVDMEAEVYREKLYPRVSIIDNKRNLTGSLSSGGLVYLANSAKSYYIQDLPTVNTIWDEIIIFATLYENDSFFMKNDSGDYCYSYIKGMKTEPEDNDYIKVFLGDNYKAYEEWDSSSYTSKSGKIGSRH